MRSATFPWSLTRLLRLALVVLSALALTAALLPSLALASNGNDQSEGYSIELASQGYDSDDNETTFVYRLAHDDGRTDSVSHILLGTCLGAGAAWSTAWDESYGKDGSITGEPYGHKWNNDVPGAMFTLTVEGDALGGATTWHVKKGNGFQTGTLAGPSCSSGDPDPDPDPEPDLTISKAATASVGLDGTVSYTITVANEGEGDASGSFEVDDVVPSEFTVNGDSVSAQAWNCDASGNTVSCSFDELGSGDSLQVTFTAEVTTSTCGTVTNTASLLGQGSGGRSEIDSDSASTDVTGCGDTGVLGNGFLEVAKVVDGDAPADSEFDFTVTCTGFALGQASTFTLVDGETEEIGIAIPHNTTCTVQETGRGDADSTSVALTRDGSSIGSVEDSSATVQILQNTTAKAVFTNVFDADTEVRATGMLEVVKVVDGDGAPEAGSEFTFTVDCDDLDLGADATIVIGEDGGTHTVQTVMEEGTSCTVVETGRGGADATTVAVGSGAAVDGAQAVAVIVGGETASVRFTNTFDAVEDDDDDDDGVDDDDDDDGVDDDDDDDKDIVTPTRIDAGVGGAASPAGSLMLVAMALAAAAVLGLGSRILFRLSA